MSIAERIKTARVRCGLTQELLTEKMSVSGSTIARWEQGKGFPRADELAALSDVLGVSTDYLIKGQEPVTVDVINSTIQNNVTGDNNITTAPIAADSAPVSASPLRYEVGGIVVEMPDTEDNRRRFADVVRILNQ